jgi:hypothetical protein
MRYVLALLLGFTIMGFGQRVFGADLPIPHPPHPAVSPSLATPLPAPIAPVKPAESCLKPGGQPAPGQTLQADKTCPSGMRWIFAR